MRIIKYSILMINTLFIIVLYLSINNRYISEKSFGLKMDYSYLYKNGSVMDVVLYSNIKDARFSYIDRNNYYLTDLNESFLVPVDINNIRITKDIELYKYDIEIGVPDFSSIYVENLYFKASNDYSDDLFNIGSLSILRDEFTESLPYKAVSKSVYKGCLKYLYIDLNESCEISEIITSKIYSIGWDYSNKRITIKFNSMNYTHQLYVIVKTSLGLIKLDSYSVGDSAVSHIAHEGFMSIMERVEV